jgi:hypothetical protein
MDAMVKQPAWEVLSDNQTGCDETAKMEVPGGWIYRYYTRIGDNPAVAMVFVPEQKLQKK